MPAALTLVRTKALAVDDADPALGVFVPPEAEIFKIADARAIGFRVALVYATAGQTATMTPFFRDARDNSWFFGTPQSLVPHRRILIIPDAGSFDAWIRLTAITGAVPIQVMMAAVFGAD